jgi:hypothetical protein
VRRYRNTPASTANKIGAYSKWHNIYVYAQHNSSPVERIRRMIKPVCTVSLDVKDTNSQAGNWITGDMEECVIHLSMTYTGMRSELKLIR